MIRPASIAAALIAAATLAVPAQAQPRFTDDGTNAQISVGPYGDTGTMTLWGGFQPNPVFMNLTARGEVPSNAIYGSPQCPGWYRPAQSYANANILWIASAEEMSVTVNSSTDTLLLIRSSGDSGDEFFCDDNSGDGHNPLIRLTPDPAGADPSGRHAAGSYDIFIGTKVQNQIVPVTLIVSEAPAGTSAMGNTALSGVPNPNLGSPSGTVVVYGGFGGEPRRMYVAAGGPHAAENLGSNCRGWVETAPSLAVEYRDPGLPLVFGAESAVDTTLVIHAPDGQWYCDDDGGGQGNPLVQIPSALAGTYQIYAGTYAQGAHDPSVRFAITEAGHSLAEPAPIQPDPVIVAPPRLPGVNLGTGPNSAGSAPAVAGHVDPDLPARDANLTLSAGFQPDPVEVNLIPGGDFQMSGLPCTGWYHDAPNAEIYYNANGTPLSIMVKQANEASVDTELAVRAPGGLWLCDDNSSMGTEPILTFSNPASGIYDVYVGSQARHTTETVVLAFSASDMRRHSAAAVSYAANPALPAIYGTINLYRGFAPDPYSINVMAGGAHIFGTTQGSCSGWVTEAPSLELSHNGGGRLIVSAGSLLDTILVVRGPDGYWHCDDDGGNSGLNPAVTLEEALPGTYDIWVGSHRQNGSGAAMLQISERHSQ